ncbi:MAG TPA: enoyl-CoA hydratase-related protein [Acidimicrobiales bacterium]|nr:enoyl-CoA hydratase-related protein [Acidimicrobiales bacterium]
MPDLPGSSVGYDVSGAVATITLTTPALGTQAKDSLLEAVGAAQSDESVRCVVLTGTGRVFCAGQDLGEHRAALEDGGSQGALSTIAAHYNPIVTALATMAKPVVAAINGSCAGAGLGLALACDIRVAAAGAKFTTAFTAIGLTPDSGLSASLARAVGTARASELVLLSQPFTAEEALAWGLVGRVVPGEQLAAEVEALAGRLAAGPTLAYAVAKRAMRQAWGAPWDQVLAAEERDQIALGATTDHQGAVEAFVNKQKPTFTGR